MPRAAFIPSPASRPALEVINPPQVAASCAPASLAWLQPLQPALAVGCCSGEDARAAGDEQMEPVAQAFVNQFVAAALSPVLPFPHPPPKSTGINPDSKAEWLILLSQPPPSSPCLASRGVVLLSPSPSALQIGEKPLEEECATSKLLPDCHDGLETPVKQLSLLQLQSGPCGVFHAASSLTFFPSGCLESRLGSKEPEKIRKKSLQHLLVTPLWAVSMQLKLQAWGALATCAVAVQERQELTRPRVPSKSCLPPPRDAPSSLCSLCQVPSNSHTCAVLLITLLGCAVLMFVLPSRPPLPPQLLWLFSST